MTGIMSFSNAPDARALGRVAGALAVDEAFVEKDWYVVQAIAALVAIETPEIVPVFSGGTSLLKAFRLINRFSEDIDFKLALSSDFEALNGSQKRKRLGTFRDALAAAWTAAGFEIISLESRSGNGFITIEMRYPTVLGDHPALRPHILAELSAKPPRLAPIEAMIASFVNQVRKGASAEVPRIACVDPVETAADKLSALTWRVLTRQRGGEKDDPTIVRHIHDLAALERAIAGSARFAELLAETMIADAGRGGGSLKAVPAAERLERLLDMLRTDGAYGEEYARYVGGMTFAGEAEVPDFSQAAEAVERLSGLLPNV